MTSNTIGRLHHITAIAADPAANLAFYQDVLGLRLVKKTVNFDDPGTYHLYYGDEVGSPGTILTFFPYVGAAQGRHGTGQAEEIAFAIPPAALGFWIDRLAAKGVAADQPTKRFGETVLAFRDPDGLLLELVTDSEAASLPGHAVGDVPAEHAIRGFRGITLWLGDVAPTARVLTEVLGYVAGPVDGARHRFTHPGGGIGSIVDLRAAPGFWAGAQGAGTIHHVAFRAADDGAQAASTRALAGQGLRVTPQQDRNYFRSTYFREPGGVLFEIATDDPGFAIDEPKESLGEKLMLPSRYEAHRAEIEAVLPKLGQKEEV
ncbi:ring-cleaving dioxygenase [Elioraea sp.]|uniref:ring-cleaving dioxygenase n=1 Tax=Elioraea sp. TaxID=2185103 RepID=UPI0025C70AE3|nr:ring-cleaving dioxygenase [Elioraea sp.]